MTAPIAIGIDLGTQQLKVLAVDIAHRRVLSTQQAAVKTIAPFPGAIEHDPADWWPLLCKLSRQLVAEIGSDSASICGVGLSGHMHSIVPLKSDLTPAYNCIIWADTRSEKEAQHISTVASGERWNPSIAAYSVPKILWLKEHHPDVFSDVKYVLFSKDFLRLTMTKVLATDFSDASGTLAWDFRAREWDASLLSDLGISPEIFPTPHESTSIGGLLTVEAASQMGLPSGIPVAIGAGDVACAVIGSGISTPNTLLINAGTAAQIILVQEEPTPFTREHGVRYLFELGIGSRTFVMGALPSAGLSLEWWRTLIGKNLTYGDLDDLAESQLGSPNNPVFLPYLQGTGTPNLIDKPLGTFLSMSRSTDVHAMTSAVMEGVALAIRRSAEALITGDGLANQDILLTGGVSKSRVMRRIFPSVFAKNVLFRKQTDVSGIGAAALGAVAAGEVASIEEFFSTFPFDYQIGDPEPDLEKRFAAKYESYYR